MRCPGDGAVVAVGVGGMVADGRQRGGVRVFDRESGGGWVPLGSIIEEGAATGDAAGASIGLSRDGKVLLVPLKGTDSRTGTLSVYVWSSEDWEQRGGRYCRCSRSEGLRP